jgi:alpha-ribazole phosphatase/probable phosphoglycerate mutase
MSTLVFVRHGETAMAGRFCGQSDPGLNGAGEFQAIHAAEAIAGLGVQRIYSSDLLRARQTADVLVQRIGVSVELRAELREIGFGLWEGLNWQEIEERYPQEAKRWLDEFPLCGAPGGETYAEFTTRVDGVIATMLGETPALRTIVVTHRGVMRYALVRFFGFTEEEAWTRTEPYGAVVIATAARRDGEEEESAFELATREDR